MKILRSRKILIKAKIQLLFSVLLTCNIVSANDTAKNVTLTHDVSAHSIRVEIDGEFFTAYIYGDPILKKPVLYPVLSSSGKTITRGYPLKTRSGERIDHTHHHGIWFNHGDVNGIDFWNAGRTPPKPNVRYGRIKHKSIELMKSGKIGTLIVNKEWYSDKDEIILNERTSYLFQGTENRRSITHNTELTAINQDVFFEDSKEGVFAIRVARELEIANNEATILTDKNLKPISEAIVDNTAVTGHYRNSEGISGYPAVWGQRARWMQLSATIKDSPISVIIFDAPSNINHPPHWMARDYGLFAVNPLGSHAYTEGKESLNFVLKESESKTFKNEIIISDGIELETAEIEQWYQDFTLKALP